MSAVESVDTTAIELACETLYRFLAAGLSNPRGSAATALFDPASQQVAAAAAECLRDEAAAVPTPAALGLGELPAEDLNLGPLLAALPATAAQLEIEHDRVFGLLGSRDCPFYEMEFHPNEDPFFRSQQMADVAGFYRAFGLEASRTERERVDHIATELEFAAHLLAMARRAGESSDAEAAGERADVCRRAYRDFLADHLTWWAPLFATAMRRKAQTGFYAAAGTILAALLPLERRRLGLAAPQLPLAVTQPPSDEGASPCEGCAAVAG